MRHCKTEEVMLAPLPCRAVHAALQDLGSQAAPFALQALEEMVQAMQSKMEQALHVPCNKHPCSSCESVPCRRWSA